MGDNDPTPILIGTSTQIVLCNPFKWDILLFILVENLVICVPTTTADCNLFNNHRNKKVVGGNYNVLVHYLDVFAPASSGVVLWNPFKWYILWFILIKNLVVCVPAMISKWISFRNQRNKKVVGGNYNVLVHYADASAPDSEGVVCCNPFIWDILWFILIKNLVICVPTTLANKFYSITTGTKNL